MSKAVLVNSIIRVFFFLMTHPTYRSKPNKWQYNSEVTIPSKPMFERLKLNYRHMDWTVSDYCNDPAKNNVQTEKLNVSDLVRLISSQNIKKPLDSPERSASTSRWHSAGRETSWVLRPVPSFLRRENLSHARYPVRFSGEPPAIRVQQWRNPDPGLYPA